MPEPTLREAILKVFKTRLGEIQTANGFFTDAGLALQIGESHRIGPDDPVPAVAVLVGDDEIVHEGERIAVTLPIDIEIVTRAEETDGWQSIERALGDVKRAMELNTSGHRLTDIPDSVGTPPQLQRGNTRTLPREEGSVTIGAVLRYRVGPFTEGWGQP